MLLTTVDKVCQYWVQSVFHSLTHNTNLITKKFRKGTEISFD